MPSAHEGRCPGLALSVDKYLTAVARKAPLTEALVASGRYTSAEAEQALEELFTRGWNAGYRIGRRK